MDLVQIPDYEQDEGHPAHELSPSPLTNSTLSSLVDSGDKTPPTSTHSSFKTSASTDSFKAVLGSGE